MIEINGRQFLKPSEIVEQKLIVNTKGKPDYRFVLRLIEDGELEAVELNKAGYKAVPVESVEQYNKRFFGGSNGGTKQQNE